MTLYHDLCDSIELINSVFTFPLILAVFYFFILNTFAAFAHIWTLTQEFEYIFFLLSTDGLVMLLNWYLQCVAVYSSSSTTQIAEETVVIITRILNSSECNSVQQKTFKNLLLQAHYRNLKFRTALFTINWKLLLTVNRKISHYPPEAILQKLILQILTTTVTYLIITFQFDPPTEIKHVNNTDVPLFYV